jgi:uncharacterized protein YegJ (DUF2314 family)
MKIIVTAVLAALAFTGSQAAEQESTHISGRQNKAPGAPGYQQVADNDRQCERAEEHAQRNLGFFIAALKAKKPGDTSFAIKKGFVDGDKVEHLWITNVTYDGTAFRGKIDNKPREVKNVRLGQRVTVASRAVSDWMFVKDGKLIGGYTTRVLYARLTPEQRAQFDREADFRISEAPAK